MKYATGKQLEESQEKQRKGRKRVLVIGIVCVVLAAAAVAVKYDRQPPDVSGSIVQQRETTAVENTAPSVLGVTPSTERIAPRDVCQLVCEATDADGDSLTFTWLANQGELVGEGATVEWTAPDVEGLFRVSVTVDDGKGGIGEQSTSVRVKENRSPEFQSMATVADWVFPGSSMYMSFFAQDPDGDEVTYEWNATGGELFGQGDSIVWVAPEETGNYRVAVTARDEYGGESAREIPVSVISNSAPVLGEFLVKAIGHNMLSFDVGVWDIFRGRSCSIECLVQNGEAPYTYEWTADQGLLTTDGAMANWEAPDVKGPATISVEVADAYGNTTIGTVLMYVETCTCHFD